MKSRCFNRVLIVSIVAMVLQCHTFAQKRQALVGGWQFCKGDLGGIWEAVRVPQVGQPTNFPMWENVSVPHCFNATDAVDPDRGYYQGAGWYRTALPIANPYPRGRTYLRFDGCGPKTDLYIGLKHVGHHVGGYDGWEMDITDAVDQACANMYIAQNYNGRIPVSVRCDNSRDLEMIPSNLSDFTIYGGLYRKGWLVYRPESWMESVEVRTTLNHDLSRAKLKLKPFFGGIFGQPSYKVSLYDHRGKLVVEQAFQATSDTIDLSVANPQLWSPDAPTLYTLNVEAIWGDHRQAVSQKIGFRQAEFQKHGPFYLNGKRLLLKGTHRHADFANVGAAETAPQIMDEMCLIKAMGANFIRLGHYQQADRVLELCDSLGILVWEEIPWCRGGLGGEAYKHQARQMLRHMVGQHGNHPSVIVWGLGNENDWPGDFETVSQDSIRLFMSELNQLAHQLDPTRLTAIRRCDFCKDIVDVYSPSIWPGWYRGKYTDYENVTHFEQQQTDRFLHVEWGADCHVGRHTEPTGNVPPPQPAPIDNPTHVAQLYSAGKNMSRDGDWSETYAAELYDWVLTQQAQMPWLTGTAFWTFKDFATPIRPENPIPYVNQKGVVQRDLTPKEVYYVVQAHWSAQPMVHVYGHSWPIRWGNANETRRVTVYSNCHEVELFVNGISHGTKKRIPNQFPAMGLTWDVLLAEGLNHVRAVGASKGKKMTDELTWTYQLGTWGPVAQITLTEEAIDDHASTLVATAIDSQGKVCLDASNPIRFDITGDAHLIKMQGTSTGSQLIQLANGQARIRLVKTGRTYAASVKAEGIPTTLLIQKQQ